MRKLKDVINRNIATEQFLIFDECNCEYFFGWEDSKPTWTNIDFFKDNDYPITWDELPKIATLEECRTNIKPIIDYYMEIDGECEGIIIKKIKLKRFEYYKIQVSMFFIIIIVLSVMWASVLDLY